METIILVILAFAIGWKLNEIFMALSFRKILEDLKVTDQALKELAERNGIEFPKTQSTADPEVNEIEIRVEEIQGRLFAYECSRDTFVAQGDDPESLLSQIIERFPPGTRITVNKEQGGDLIKAAADKLKAAT